MEENYKIRQAVNHTVTRITTDVCFKRYPKSANCSEGHGVVVRKKLSITEQIVPVPHSAPAESDALSITLPIG